MKTVFFSLICLSFLVKAQQSDSVDVKASQVTVDKLQAWQRNSYRLSTPNFASQSSQHKNVTQEPIKVSSNREPYMFGMSYYSYMGYSPYPNYYSPYAYPQMGYGYMASPYLSMPVTSPATFVGNVMLSAGLDYLLNPRTRERFKKK